MSIGKIVNKVLGTGGDGGAGDYLKQAIAEYTKLEGQIPTVEQQKVLLQHLVQQGLVTPEDAQTVNLEDSSYNDISIDPYTRNAQIGALESLQGIASDGGLDDIDKAKLQDVFDAQNTENRGQQEAIMENFRERGLGGSGMELANRLESQQGSANRAQKQGLDVAAQAQQRALDAIAKSGELGGQIHNQDYAEAAKKAEAADAIKRFNAQNKQAVINQNVANRNTAQAVNLGEKQRISDTNTINDNNNSIRNSNLIQQRFQNQKDIAAGKAGINTQQANMALDQARREDQTTGAVLGTGASIVAGSMGGPGAAAATKGATTNMGAKNPTVTALDAEEQQRRKGIY